MSNVGALFGIQIGQVNMSKGRILSHIRDRKL